MTMITDFDKVLRVFESCENHQQFDIAKNLLSCFFEKHRDQFDSVSRQKTLCHIQAVMDDCVARFVSHKEDV